MQIEQIKEDLLMQLREDGNDKSYFIDLVKDYISLCDVKNRLIEDIDQRGVNISSVNGYKKNDSVLNLTKINHQMLKLLRELNIVTKENKSVEEVPEL